MREQSFLPFGLQLLVELVQVELSLSLKLIALGHHRAELWLHPAVSRQYVPEDAGNIGEVERTFPFPRRGWHTNIRHAKRHRRGLGAVHVPCPTVNAGNDSG